MPWALVTKAEAGVLLEALLETRVLMAVIWVGPSRLAEWESSMTRLRLIIRGKAQ